jgi:hypothetical protein
MLKVIPDIITRDEAKILIEEHCSTIGVITPYYPKPIVYHKRNRDFSNKIIKKIVKIYQSYVDSKELVLESPSYWKTQEVSMGHKWHYDGCKEVDGEFKDNHMAWCEYGSTILLTNPNEFEGGKLSVMYEGKELEIDVNDHYLSGIFYTSGKYNNPVKHKVTSFTGTRIVLSMMFAIN